jgi:hypothetical protein
MALLISDLKTQFGYYKKDISDVDDDLWVQWSRYMLTFIYKRLKAIDPERFISEDLYYVETDPDTFTLPSGFQDFNQTGTGFFEISDATLAYDAQTANFTVGATLTGGTSGATAMIKKDSDNETTGTLTIKNISGTFQNDEVITGSSGGSATANGTPAYKVNKENQLSITGFGSTNEGYYLHQGDMIFTNAKEKTFMARWIPEPVIISSVDQYFTLDGTETGLVLVENRDEEYLIKAYDVMYEQWNGNNENVAPESVADFRLVRALGDVLSYYNRTPQISQMYNPTTDF